MTTTEGDGRSRRRPKHETRQAILRTACEMAAREGVPERIDLRLASVLAEMNLTSGAAYNIWPSQEHFQRDLAMELATNFLWASPEANEIAIDPDAVDPIAELRRLAEQYFEAFTTREENFIALRFWGTKEPTEDLRQAVQNGYAMNHESWKKLYLLGLEWTGRQMRDGFDLDDFVVAVTALTEGAALRHRFEPDRMKAANGRHIHSEMLVAVFEYFTEPGDS